MSALNILLTSCTIILITSREWAFGQNFVHCCSVHLHFIKVAKENWSHHSNRSYTNDEMLILELFRRRVFIVEFWLFGFHAWVRCLWVPLIRNSYNCGSIATKSHMLTMRHDFLHHLLHFFWTSQNSQAQAYNFIKKETGVSNKMHLGKNYQDFLK